MTSETGQDAPDQGAEEAAARTALHERFPHAAEALDRYAAILRSKGIEWGLLGPREGDRIWSRHVSNSLALVDVLGEGIDVADATILLDGSHDWLSPSLATPLRVVVCAKADRDCASVACAAVLAKLERDRLMVAADAEAPMYAWASNKGYASAVHIAAIREHGPHGLHRTSWVAGILADASAP